MLPRVKVIYEARGASVEEFKYSNDINHLSFKAHYKYKNLRFNERVMVRHSDKVFVVSKALQKYFIHRYGPQISSKILVVPGAADKSIFSINNNSRDKLREEFNVKDKTVLVYSGKISMKWEIPDTIFQFFSYYHKIYSNLLLFLLTPDIQLANEYKKKYKLTDGSIIILNANYREVGNYLNMADLGLLLREDMPINNLASPTKFAEYMLCGLPVLLSDSVYDFADHLNETSYGALVNTNNFNSDQPIDVNSLLSLEKKIIADWAIQNLSKESFIKSIVKSYKII